MIPTDVWRLIADYCEPNPFIYTSWAHVCRSSRQAFYENRRWLKFTPVESASPSLALDWQIRVARFSQHEFEIYKLVWNDITAIWKDPWDQDWRATQTAIIKGFVVSLAHDPDMNLATMVWFHLGSPSWRPSPERRSQDMTTFVYNRNCLSFAFQACAARLYGPLIKFLFDVQDNRDVVVAALEWDLGPTMFEPQQVELSDWWLRIPWESLGPNVQNLPEVLNYKSQYLAKFKVYEETPLQPE